MKSDRILTIGPAYKEPEGGVAAVEKTYSAFYNPFNHIATFSSGNGLAKLCLAFKAYLLFLFFMLKKEIKIVHVHGASGTSFWRKSVFILTARSFGKKIVYHIHGGGFKVYAAKHPKATKFVIRKCDAIVLLSDNWKDFFLNNLDAKKVSIIPNPVDYPKENHDKRTDKVIQFLFLGTINKDKGIYDLLEVINENIKHFRGHAVFRIGGLGETEKLKSFVDKNKLSDIVKYEGWVDGDNKTELFNKSHVLILPSYIEGVPICILEAESYHLPIIATNVGGIPSIVKHGVNGYLLIPGDKQALGNAIGEMINNKEKRERMGRNSYQFAESHQLPKVENAIRNLYDSLLD